MGNFSWRIDYSYKDLGVKLKRDGYHPDDQFASKVSIDREKHWGIANASGIRVLKSGISGKKQTELPPAALFLITTHPSSTFHNPWEDSIDPTTGTVLYWGDAKAHSKKSVDDWQGNAILAKIHDDVLKGSFQKAPPIFYFVKERKSEIVFKGLCALDKLERSWFEDEGKRVINYRATLSLLNVEEVNPEWIKHRALNGNNDTDCLHVPIAWKKYIASGLKDKLFVWRRNIVSKKDQLPSKGERGDGLLKQLENLDPFLFEKAICRMLEGHPGVVHKIKQTREVKDGGFDMEGEFRLPSPFSYPVRFKGEVKRHKSAVGPEYVSRLVARLGRGEYGLFFTTSFFTDAAQKEVIEDGYPVRLICGVELYNFFYEARLLDENGVIKSVWLEQLKG